MKPFSFIGNVPASKSMINRALICQTYSPSLKIIGASNCEDVRNMKLGIVSMIQKKPIFCGDAGTVLRFIAARASRIEGTYKMTGSKRLFERPQQDLAYILEQLSVHCQLIKDEILIHGEGWKKPLVPVRVPRDSSSQFATGLLLNSWDLPFDLELDIKTGVSESYFKMTVQMLQSLGLQIEHKNDFWRIPAGQKIANDSVVMEPDYSSAFAIASAGALAGSAVINGFTDNSLQPDYIFIDILKKMGAKIELKKSVNGSGSQLHIKKSDEELNPIEFNLQNCPDLFPVLAVVCAFAKGESKLIGAPHLKNKESNRIQKISDLFEKAGIFCTVKNDGMHIVGYGKQTKLKDFTFDTDHDHRIAMAAGLLKLKGFGIQIQNPQVVNKSYPEFWQAIGINP
jgi:3-phosphoshikimate 1-carboxyvinyltransferase